MLANGIDPSINRKTQKEARIERSANSFETIAREWFSKMSSGWAASHADKVIKRLENDIFPWIGGRPIADITAPELLKVLHRIESRGAHDTAHRAQQNCGQVFRYAIVSGKAERDPSADLKGALRPAKHKHFASITASAKVGELLRAFDAFKGTLVVKAAATTCAASFRSPR